MRAAVTRLDTWIREYEAGQFLDALKELREAVEHLTECSGFDRTCADTTEACETTPADDCEHCATPCEECKAYREGRDGTVWRQRPLLQLLDVIEAQGADLYEFIAS